VHCNIVAEGFQGLPREGFVDGFRLLQANDVRLTLGEPGEEIFQPLLDRIDVPGCDSHRFFDLNSEFIYPE